MNFKIERKCKKQLSVPDDFAEIYCSMSQVPILVFQIRYLARSPFDLNSSF